MNTKSNTAPITQGDLNEYEWIYAERQNRIQEAQRIAFNAIFPAVTGPEVLPEDMADYECFTCGGQFCKHGQCRTCGENCDSCAEAQEQRWLERYYGGEGPLTFDERLMESWEQKKKLDR